jgi:predicted nucleic acid-binding protein
MLHVFVETNWVVYYAAPAHYRESAAVRLLDRARSGELQLHLPVICLSEARRPILTMHRSRQGEIGEFLKWAKKQALVTANDDSGTRRVLNLLELQVKTGLAQLDQMLKSLMHETGVDVFSFDGAMAEKTAVLSLEKTDLQPFDQAILAAVLVRAGTLRSEGEY